MRSRILFKFVILLIFLLSFSWGMEGFFASPADGQLLVNAEGYPIEGTVFEAEHRTSESDCRRSSEHEGYTGSGYLDFGDNGAWMEWDNIDVAQAGEYTLIFRYANGSSSDREAKIKVNGDTVGYLPFESTGSWTEWKTASIEVALKQGDNTIFVKATTDKGGPNLDHLMLVNAEGYPIEGTVFEAEDRTSQDDCKETSEHSGYTGSAYMDFGGDDAWIEWDNIDVAQAGEYTLSFRYANGKSSDREAKIKVNGDTVGYLPFKSTGDWENWSAESIAVELERGDNTIFVKATTDNGGPNLDHVVVIGAGSDDQCPDDPSKTEPGLCGCGVPEGTCNNEELLAFPTAEGHGRLAKGGRGGDVYHVTNLNDNGAGSLREGIESASGPRTIVFEVSGTIKLKSNLVVSKSYITIAGQTAPGDGITLRGGTFNIHDAEHVIVRYLRVRYGDETEDGDPDAIRTNSVKHVIFDHISASWGVDSIHDLRDSESFTLQWSLYGEALDDSVHPKGAHAMLASFRDVQDNISIHHNVFHSSRQRHPTLGGGTKGNFEAVVDFRNNLNFNWEGETNFGNLKVNFINNYYKPGRSTDVDEKPLRVKAEFAEISRGYLRGNYFKGNDRFTNDNYKAIDYSGDGKYGSTTRERFEVEREFEVVAPATHPTASLPDLLLPRVGASLRRDAADKRIIAGIIDGTNVLIDSQDEVGGWPKLQSLPAPADSDRDGMPDAWEIDNGLDPDTQDNNGTDLSPEGYTNLEVYLNSLVVSSGPVSPPSGETVIFAAFGDYGDGAGSKNEQAVADLVDSFFPDFIITTGDNNYIDSSKTAAWDEVVGDYYGQYIRYPAGSTSDHAPGPETNAFFPSLGNHDWDAGGQEAYFDLPGAGIPSSNTSGNERYYDFVRGPVHFFAIDSDDSEPDGRTSDSKQARWLQAQLAASTSPWKIVFMHHPPYSSSEKHGSEKDLQWPYDKWGVTAVLAGHDHLYERIVRDDYSDDDDGIPYFITGAGGKSLYSFGTRVAGSEVRYNANYGSMIVEASSTRITFEFWSVEDGGTLIDTYTITK